MIYTLTVNWIALIRTTRSFEEAVSHLRIQFEYYRNAGGLTAVILPYQCMYLKITNRQSALIWIFLQTSRTTIK